MAKPVLQMPATKPAETSEPNPMIGKTVLVRTSKKINGQSEHAAIITQVMSDDVINVMVFPGEGQPYPIAAISRLKHSPLVSLSWRWPPR